MRKAENWHSRKWTARLRVQEQTLTARRPTLPRPCLRHTAVHWLRLPRSLSGPQTHPLHHRACAHAGPSAQNCLCGSSLGWGSGMPSQEIKPSHSLSCPAPALSLEHSLQVAMCINICLPPGLQAPRGLGACVFPPGTQQVFAKYFATSLLILLSSCCISNFLCEGPGRIPPHGSGIPGSQPPLPTWSHPPHHLGLSSQASSQPWSPAVSRAHPLSTGSHSPTQQSASNAVPQA